MKLQRFKGDVYYNTSAKQNVLRIKPTFWGRIFPKYTLIVKEDFNEKSENIKYY